MHHRTTIIGNLGADPEIKYLPSGGAAANFSIAVNEKWKDKQTGEQKEHTEWYRCNAYGKLAELIGEYRKKGDLVYVEGRNRTRSWETDSGEKRFMTELNVDTMRGLSGRRSAGGDTQGQGQGQGDKPGQPGPGTPGPDDFDDDIPF
jgi:single-strand DNA-binding protein